jgi:hypothetical protein
MMMTGTASIRTRAENAKRPEASLTGNRCDAELKREGASIRETLLNAICFLLLLAILALVGYFAERWIERHLDRPLWHPLWHEPLDESGMRSQTVPLSLFATASRCTKEIRSRQILVGGVREVSGRVKCSPKPKMVKIPYPPRAFPDEGASGRGKRSSGSDGLGSEGN